MRENKCYLQHCRCFYGQSLSFAQIYIFFHFEMKHDSGPKRLSQVGVSDINDWFFAIDIGISSWRQYKKCNGSILQTSRTSFNLLQCISQLYKIVVPNHRKCLDNTSMPRTKKILHNADLPNVAEELRQLRMKGCRISNQLRER